MGERPEVDGHSKSEHATMREGRWTTDTESERGHEGPARGLEVIYQKLHAAPWRTWSNFTRFAGCACPQSHPVARRRARARGTHRRFRRA
ncbi:hypothetical protein MMF93_25695 [Streptomyces tubbatahanensis]|uniref:Transposase n=1 Tax=Streptomyces tubbatahanensis TaxID=2923272 RepID=A0ABY3XZR4_9ACTN|nr:hypothetical protein [Streptomyces tubbatahanensis]UNS99468.1 hypothetical protein MMF93_25695 [Streptomyces tubbatahanensis]